jgi:ectoine hydroxylase-related dioxygenase (phytanoyl-CoA dioxygenase family)
MTTISKLDTPFVLGERVRQHFEDHGFVRLKGVLSEETIDAYGPEITQKVIELNTMHLPLEERTTYHKAFLQVWNLWEHSERVREFVFSRRLAQIACDLMGVRAVRLLHDQALYKEPGGGITPWHADQYYWPLSSDRVCTVWAPLQETPLDMRPLEFAVGSHRFTFGRDLEISDESEAKLQEALAQQNFEIASGPYGLGEVSYHFGWIFHHAQPNRSQSPRRVMTIIYMDADITVTEAVNDGHRSSLATVLPGARAGEVADTPLNPLLYTASSSGATKPVAGSLP